ncbi:MAG: DUF3108 domain-containing protein [Burkholderiaceae bacterium]|nr:MAG: DUF3108 domain-containing protein [Burkholderiaceae bacterium]TBR77369.1 MAG: DUF3108 domain-containing protein [Burkholderiaceae bacterium]
MARSARLGRRIAALALAVLLAHWAVLAWLANHWQEPSVLRPMTAPMLTREIVPTAPPSPVSEKKVAATPANKEYSATKSIVVEKTSHAPVAPPQPVASAPDAAVSAPVAPASAPGTAASAPAGSSITPLDDTARAPASSTNDLDAWPADTRISYTLGGYYRGALKGTAQVLWQRQGDEYQARIEVDLGWLFSMSMTSQGRVTAAGLAPRAYEELVRGRHRDILLNADSVTLPSGRQVPRPPGVQDTISQFIDLAYQFSTGHTRLQVGHPFQRWLARPGGVGLWTYDVPEEVSLYIPRLGPVQAFHIKPLPPDSAPGDITVELWFAPSLQYLPVRIRLNLGDGASYMDLMADRIEQR